MIYSVKSINIDFQDDDFECPYTMQQDIIHNVLNQFWDSTDLDSLTDEISNEIGFSILSIEADPIKWKLQQQLTTSK